MTSGGFSDLIVICVIALLVLGPERLPGAGEAIRGFKSSVEGTAEAKRTSSDGKSVTLGAGVCP